ncbi:SDR family NAD(P)-dependent oxidoreductase [Sorangium sp. So ce834]|uniref:SDR family NAD(P)-dependent oxidoreductase n=1 Tax=Sorangium sp. So ce834 TaxID=3133321 RepID=UPI003F638588
MRNVIAEQARRETLEKLARREIDAAQALSMLQALRRGEQGTGAHEASGIPGDRIAIIGMSSRFPGANDYNEFWQNLAQGRSSIGEVPADRWRVDEHFGDHVDEAKRVRSKWGGFLSDVDKFDPLFFRMSGREAERSDPQHRLFLEECWKAIEDAGYNPEVLSARRVGVFAGANSGDYIHRILESELGLDALSSVGNTASLLSSRIAYYLNLKGPSVTVDTACSSSLVAVHLGCQSILTGENELVLAGGVFVSTTALFYIMCSRTGMLSPKGRCSAFDASADGFVLGEGVGVVLLKRLDAAVRDGDHIYGVIRASGINQDGKTNGITAPCTLSQTELELDVYRKAGISAADITYVEAHGTGTKLGDPIEIEALTNAFRAHTDKVSYCAVGSVKTNVGHGAFSAGMAGLVKVLLCLKHKQLVPSLNFHVLNPHIGLEHSPFFVNTELRAWETAGRRPRLAALSSFGWSGTNAHLVVEEWPDSGVPAAVAEAPAPCLIVVSAASRSALMSRCRDLAKHCRGDGARLSLRDVAYTLAVGRAHHAWRVALVVTTREELIDELEGILRADGRTSPGRISADASPAAVSSASELIRALKQGATAAPELRDRLLRLAELYTSGCSVEWSALYRGEARRRVPLPAYPFARESYWLPVAGGGRRTDAAVETTSGRHALLERTAVNERGGEFSAVLLPSTDLVRDHVVSGQRLLPAAGAIEMVVAAAAPVRRSAPGYKIRRVTWLVPMAVGEAGLKIRGTISAASEGYRYELSSESNGERAVHSRGELCVSGMNGAGAHERVNLSEVRSRCQRSLSKVDIYAAYRSRGVEYGAQLQVLDAVWVGDGEALGRLAPVEPTAAGYHLDPRMVDGALQTAGMSVDWGEDGRVMVPFSAEEVEIAAPLEASAYVYVQCREGSRESQTARFDVTVLDEEGGALLKINDVCARALSTGRSHRESSEAKPERRLMDELTYYRPVWRKAALRGGQQDGSSDGSVLVCHHGFDLGLPARLAERHRGAECVRVLLGKSFRELAGQGFEIDHRARIDYEGLLARLGRISTIYFLGGLQDASASPMSLEALESMQQLGVMSLLRLTQALGGRGEMGRGLSLKVVTNDVYRVVSSDEAQPIQSSVLALARVVSREYPRARVSAIDLCARELEGTSPTKGELVRWLSDERPEAPASLVAYRRGRRYRQGIERIEIRPTRLEDVPLRHRGVYVIIGGAGGIGRVVSQYLAETVRARVAIIGRSELDRERQEQLDRIVQAGGEAMYLQADATELRSMDAAVAEVKERWGSMHGVIYSALVLRDSSIARMEESSFRAALDPKVKASVILGRLLQHEPLDWLTFFSSGNSLTCSAGQSNYVAGCAFQDAFAEHLRDLVRWPVKVINWGYWGQVGVVASARYAKEMTRMGVGSISCEEGLDALGRVLHGRVNQVMPIKAAASLLESLGVNLAETALCLPESASVIGDVVGRLRAHVSSLMGGADGRLEGLEEVEAWGRDTLLVALQGMGALKRAHEVYDERDFARKIGAVEPHEKLCGVLCAMLERHGVISRVDGQIRSSAILDDETFVRRLHSLPERRRQLEERYRELVPHLALLSSCLSSYGDVLRGEKPPTDVLFPGSSLHLVESVYKGNRRADYFNDLTAEAVEQLMRAKLSKGEPARGERIKILEIGSGTGGTSAPVLKKLARYRELVQYYYTDISLAFTRHGERVYGRLYDFVKFKTLNIEKDIEAQGYAVGEFDVIVAANVIHATQRMDATLERVKKLMKANGVLVLNEGTLEQDFATLTFGLTPGWWAYEDAEERSGSGPLITVEKWRRLLEEGGFRRFAAFGTPSARGEQEDAQHVMLAESDGVVIRRASSGGDSASAGQGGAERRPSGEGAAPAPAQPPDASAASRPSPPRAAEPERRPTSAAAAPVALEPGTGSPRGRELHDAARRYLQRVFSEVLRVQYSDIDPEQPFERYGVDSLVAMSVVERLQADFGPLPATVLFEFLSLDALADYLIQTRRENLVACLGASGLPPAAAASEESGSREVRPGRSPASAVEGGRRLVSDPARQDIAVVGMACRYPGAEDHEEFWRNIRGGRDCITDVPPRRRPLGFGGAERGEWGGFIDGIDSFDPTFFNISPLEAELMDPQERIFLETAWRTIEDAGYSRRSLVAAGDDIGVFVGVMYGEYQCLGAKEWARGNEVEARSAYWSIANRVSYHFGFQGPSMAVDTACSSSLTAIHLACESIRRGECVAAVAGGINLIMQSEHYEFLRRAQMLAPDGRCRSFGEHAQGLVPGEGVGAVLLRPLDLARQHGDHIYGVIRGTAVNHGGKTSGYTVPNPNAHARLISKALRSAGVHPRTITYLEAHGTGTALGDPIEIAGLSKAFAQLTLERQFCAIGSVKSNIGHLEAAAGIAGVSKILMQMKYGELAPSLHAGRGNAGIDFSSTPFKLQRELGEWQRPRAQVDGREEVHARRAGISSFGAGGANAHAILEEYDDEDPVDDSIRERCDPELVILSARTRPALQTRAAQLKDYLERHADAAGAGQPPGRRPARLRDVAHTLRVGREAMEFRLAVVARDKADLLRKLIGYLGGIDENSGIYYGQAQARNRRGTRDAEDRPSLARHLLDEGRLEELAKLWVSGIELDWDAVYPRGNRRRVSLPAYPFAGKCYWIQARGEGAPRGLKARDGQRRSEPPCGTEARGGAGDGDGALEEVLSRLAEGELTMDEVARRLQVEA